MQFYRNLLNCNFSTQLSFFFFVFFTNCTRLTKWSSSSHWFFSHQRLRTIQVFLKSKEEYVNMAFGKGGAILGSIVSRMKFSGIRKKSTPVKSFVRVGSSFVWPNTLTKRSDSNWHKKWGWWSLSKHPSNPCPFFSTTWAFQHYHQDHQRDPQPNSGLLVSWRTGDWGRWGSITRGLRKCPSQKIESSFV